MTKPTQASPEIVPQTAKVYCPMCTHTVEARIQPAAAFPGSRRRFVEPGQKCAHCSASLDAGYIFPVRHAA